MAICYVSNPFSYFNATDTDSYDLTGNWRLVKPMWFKQKPYEQVILGTSRCQSGFDPDHIEEHTGNSTYNLSLPGMNYYEAYSALPFLYDNLELGANANIIIGLDTYLMPFNKEAISTKRSAQWIPKSNSFKDRAEFKINFYSKLLFSGEALEGSFTNLNGKNKIDKLQRESKTLVEKLTLLEGEKENKTKANQKFEAKIKGIQDKIAYKKEALGKTLAWKKNGFSTIGLNRFKQVNTERDLVKWRKRKKFVYGEEKLDYFVETIKFFCDKDLTVKLLHLPMHNHIMNLFETLSPGYLYNTKLTMAESFLEETRNCKCKFELYDYLYPNEYNSENIIGESNYFRDLSHMRSAYGEEIINEIFSDTKLSLGYKIQDLQEYELFLEESKLKLTNWANKIEN